MNNNEPTNDMQTQFSTQYLTQLFQRLFNAQTPKFFNIMATFFAVVGALLGLSVYLQSELIDAHKAVPEWLEYAQIGLKAILYLSGFVAAKSAIQTPETPPLASEIEKPTLESQAKQIADLQAKVDALTPKTMAFPVSQSDGSTTGIQS